MIKYVDGLSMFCDRGGSFAIELRSLNFCPEQDE